MIVEKKGMRASPLGDQTVLKEGFGWLCPLAEMGRKLPV